MNRKITFLLTLLFLGHYSNIQAQTCPSNIDFELGTYVNWTYYTATTLTSLTSVVWGTPSGPVAGRHALTSGTGTDAYGFFPVVAPGGGTYSLKLGNNVSGGLDEKASYTLTVPSTSGIWSLIYRYAVVLENPGHAASIQPKMDVYAYDNTTSSTVPCTSYTYVSSSSVPGFSLSSVPVGGTYDVYYKPWTYGNMKFPGLGGHSVTVNFEAFDCGAGGHFGYGYIDMTCGFFANSVIGCASGSTVLSAPDGFSSYAWYDSTTFGTSYGTSQIITITAPTVTTTYAVILTPYTGYGCPDTLYTEVIPSTLVVHPSHDTSICSGNSVTLSAGATTASPPLTYSWTPATGLSCTTCSSTTATPSVTTTYSVTVTDGASCTKTVGITVTVVPTPCAIAGPTKVCPLGTAVLSDCAPGGTWSCGPSTTGTINPISGILTGITTGTVSVVYSTGGGMCYTSRVDTVVAAPSPILPTAPNVCVGGTTTVTDSTPGGTWSVTPTGVYASIGSATGVVTGIFAGTTSVITYTAPTGCIATRGVTVNPLPSPITGITTVCLNSTSPLFELTTGGTWSCTPTTTVTVNPLSGVIYGAALGTATVSYTLPTGCFVTTTVTVAPLPSPIVGPTNVCLGATGITYTDATAGGAWSVSNPSIAYVDMSGNLSTYATGVDTIYYSNGTCASMLAITVNPIPGPVTGVPSVCVGGTTTLSAPGTTTWTSSDTTKATVGFTTGVVTGITTGIANITCTSPAGCYTVTPVVVNPQPLPITGPTSLCVGTTITLSDPTPGGTFSTSPATVASVTPTGVVTGLTTGTELITYTSLITGCSRTMWVTVNTSPSPITGVMTVCVGATTGLSDVVPAGTWSCTPTTVGTISPTSGVLTGLAAGTDTVSYSLGAGCTAKAVVTVNPLPPAISPTAPNVCVGATTTLTDPSGPGTWSASCTALSIGTSSGIVSGLSAGTCTVTYKLTSTGCTTTRSVTVNPNPVAILPPAPTVCKGSTTTLTDGSGGGTWSSLTTPIGTVTPTGGVVTGIAPGTATIKYTLPTGCFTTIAVTVNPLPTLFSVTGGGAFCSGGTGVVVGLSGSTVGVSYQLLLGGSPIGSPVAGTGAAISFGLQTLGGTYTVQATITATGCQATMTGSAVVTVNPLPLPIVGPTAVCVAAHITLSDGTPGGTWHSSNPLAATCLAGPSPTTTVTGVTTGLSTTISYTLPTGCYVTTTVNVSPSPGPILGVSSVCVGACTTLSDTVVGGLWSTSSPGIATVGTSSGSVCGVTAGAAVITYSLGTGCTRVDTMTVTAAPLPITGVSSMCVGACDTFHDATLGGSWLLDPASTGLGTIGAGTGIFCGTSAGVAILSYAAAGGTGCAVQYSVSVNPIPGPISGSNQVCVGSCTTLTDGTPGGTWTISPSTYASVGITSGSLCGAVAGSPSTVKYTVAGCSVSMPVTVNPLPGVITGTAHVCQGSTTTLSSSTGGGTWSSSSTLIAGVTPGPSPTTTVTGGSTTGIATITYTLPTGCLRTTPITVNLTPAPISGAASVCVGHSAALIDATPGGVWSSSVPTVASVGPTTGIVTGSSAGCVTITYTVGSCYSTFSFCVLAPPSAIVGPNSVCLGDTVRYSDTTLGGTWTSSLPAMATINSTTGLLTAVASGTVIISYSTGSGCSTPKAVVINPISPILGTPVVCQGQTIHLIDTSLGGTWSSLSPLVATVNPTTGVVYGAGPGTATIRYTLVSTGCTTSVVVTVNPAPSAITGPSQVCVGSSIGLASSPGGGTWASSAPLYGTVDPALGIVSGIAPGTTTITYALVGTTGCSTSMLVTVNANPVAISGPSSVCVGSTISLFDVTPGGMWSSSAPATGSVSTTGVVAGIAVGTTNIIYTVPATSCSATKAVNVVNPPPAPTGTLAVCQGSTTTLTDAVGPGTWNSSNPTIAPIDPSSGVVTGNNPGIATITFSIGTGCISPAVVVTVNPLPGPIIGSVNLCDSSSETLTDILTGGTWSSSNPAVGTIDPSSGYVTGMSPGVTIITYLLPTGCSTSMVLTVSPSVPPITGINLICIGSTTTLSDAAPGGTWSSSAPAIAPVDPVTGVVTGAAIGSAIISYNTGAACIPTMVVSVNPLPTAISGSPNICQGSSTTMTDGVPGGVWTSSFPALATVGSASGVVTGVVTGIGAPVVDTITYMLGAGCSTNTTIIINPLPAAIAGPNNVCVGQAITLSDATPGGTWSSSSPAIGSVDAFGDVSGIGAGVTNISYTNSYTCSAVMPVTVNAAPTPITGSFNVCLGGTSTLHDALPGGRWWSSNTTVATVDSITGVVYGVALGNATIIYTYHSSCFVSQVITVNPLPTAFTVTGGGNHCSADTGVHIRLSGSTLGVNYMVYRGTTAVGSFAGTGTPMDFGLFSVAGVYTVVGTSTATGCSITQLGSAIIGIIPSVTPSVRLTLSPGDTVCAGTTVTITPIPVNGGSSPSYVWSVNSHPVALTGTYSYIPANGDTVMLTMTSSATCATPLSVSASKVLVVNPFANPVVSLSVTPDDTVCKGTMVTVHANAEYGGTAPYFAWFKNNAPMTTGAGTFSFMPNDGDVVYATMTSNYPCRLSNADTSVAITIKVDTAQYPMITINANPGTTVGRGQPVKFTAVVANAVSPTYQWYINGSPAPGVSNADTFVYSSFSYPVEDSISVAVTNNGTCTITAHQWVYIKVTTVGVQTVSAGMEDISVIPNPNKGEFTVKGSLGTNTDEEVAMEITDVLGQVVYKSSVIAKNGKLNESIKLKGNVANGMYMLSLHTGTENKVFHVVIEQ